MAAYNGGPRNVTKLASVLKRMKVDLTELGRPGEQPAKPVPCPCVWKEVASDVIPVTIPRYNNENRWYIEKYQSILSVFEEGEQAVKREAFASTDAADPYLWLEEIDSARALNWVRAKNAETMQKLASQPIYQELRSEALAALDSPSRLPDVEQMGPWIYNFWKDDAHPRGIYRRATLEEFRKPEPAWETVLDIDELAQRENTPWVFHGMDCLPPEYKKCLLSLSPGGGDADEVREFDPETRAFVPDGFSVPVAKTAIAWRDADSVFLGTDFGPGSMTESGYPRQVRLWTRGTPRARAPVLFETKPKSVGVTGFRLRSDGGDVDLIADNRTFYETDYYQLLADGSLHRLELPATAQINDVYAGRLIVSLKDDWQRGERKFARDSILLADPSVLRATGEGARGGGLDVLAESSGSEVVLGAVAAKSGILVTVLDNVRGRLYRYEEAASGWTRRQIPLPDNGSLEIASVDGTSGDAFVTFEDFVTPPTLYYVADGNPVPEPVKQQSPTFDGSRFEVSQHWAISADGTRVPYFQVAPKGMVLDGSRPTHIFSYGGFRNALVPSYSGSYEQLYGAYGKTWLERGGVFVLANIRGGGEFGEAWHQGAVRREPCALLRGLRGGGGGPDRAEGDFEGAPGHRGPEQRRLAGALDDGAASGSLRRGHLAARRSRTCAAITSCSRARAGWTSSAIRTSRRNGRGLRPTRPTRTRRAGWVTRRCSSIYRRGTTGCTRAMRGRWRRGWRSWGTTCRITRRSRAGTGRVSRTSSSRIGWRCRTRICGCGWAQPAQSHDPRTQPRPRRPSKPHTSPMRLRRSASRACSVGREALAEIRRLVVRSNLEIRFFAGHRVRALLRPLDRLFDRLHFPDPEAGDELLGLGERAVDDRPFRAVEANALAVLAGLQAVAALHDAGLDELFVIPAHLGEHLRHLLGLLEERLRFAVRRGLDENHDFHRSHSFAWNSLRSFDSLGCRTGHSGIDIFGI